MYIQLTNVSKKIKSNDILKDINLRMESGKIYGFKGKNGCGKTMLMRAISGLIKVKGTVDINGQIIGNLRSRGGREVLPLTGENAATLNQLVGGMQGYRIYGTDGISATLVGNAGGVGAKTGLYFIDQSNHAPKITGIARCLTARYTAGMTNHTAMNSAVLEVHPVLTPERMEKRQNGRRMKEDGEPMFTLTSQDRHGVYLCEKADSVKVKNGTKKGYDIASEGDGINLSYPDSKTRRGRVGKGSFL